MKTLRHRLTAVAATGLLLAAPVAFAPSAAAIETGDGTTPVIETEDGVAISPLSADLAAEEVELDPSVVGEDGELDRSDLARTPIVDEDGDGYEDIAPLNVTEIEPISGELEEEDGSATGWIIGGVAAAAVVGVGAVVLVRRRAAA